MVELDKEMMMDEQKLNKKLAEWAGFKKIAPPSFDAWVASGAKDAYYQSPDDGYGQNRHCERAFPESISLLPPRWYLR